MNEIICPNCKTAFKVDETGYADILKQVRDLKFDEEIQARLVLANKEKDSAIELTKAQIKNTIQDTLSKKEQEIAQLKERNNRFRRYLRHAMVLGQATVAEVED